MHWKRLNQQIFGLLAEDASRTSCRRVYFGLRLGLALCTPAIIFASDSYLALVGGTVITATGASPIPDAVVLIKNDRILALGQRASVAVPNGARVIETKGKFITPGMIDTNVHLVLMTIPEFLVKYEDRFEDIAVESAQITLKYGVTTVMDSWGPMAALIKARERINRGEVAASRVLIAGNIVGLGGPFSTNFMGSWPLRGLDLRYGGWVHPMIQARINAMWEAGAGPELIALTPAEIAEAMRKYLDKGPDFIKVAVSAHGIEPVEPLMFSMEQLRAIREEVRKAGRHFQTHTYTLESLRIAVEMDPQLLQHPNAMNVMPNTPAQRAELDTIIAEIKRKHIYCALMGLPSKDQSEIIWSWKPGQGTPNHQPQGPYVDQIMLNRHALGDPDLYKKRLGFLKPWIDAKVPFTLATDSGVEASELGPVVWGRLGRRHFENMESLQDAGVPPMEILMGATRRGAEAYGLANEIGSVEVGKIADLVVLDANPLESVRNLRRLHSVIKGGKIIDRAALPTVKVIHSDSEAQWPY
jgi:imidazolonepropionase-like amidohydrolase